MKEPFGLRPHLKEEEMNNLVELRKKADAAKAVYDGIGCVNVWNKTAEERVQIDLIYEKARRDWGAAEDVYRSALQATEGGGSP